MNEVQRGGGRTLLLIHGLGGSWQSWSTIMGPLSAERTVIAIDLPGHGVTPANPDSGTFDGLVGSVERYIGDKGLDGVDIVGSSIVRASCWNLPGAAASATSWHWILAASGAVGSAHTSRPLSAFRGGVVRAIRPMLPMLSKNAASRSALLAQLSARPWALDPDFVATELASLSTTSTFDALVRDLANGPEQVGPASDHSRRIVIGWGRHDRLCLPRQAERAKAAFTSSDLHWFEASGHFPMWDQPDETVAVILAATR